MNILREKNKKYFYFIVFIFMQLFVDIYSADPISCVICGGNTTKCSENRSEKPAKCSNESFTKCYTQIDVKGNIERGCSDAEIEKNCKIENNCMLTEAEKNNQLICKQCEGSDEKCSQSDMNLNDVKYNKICDANTEKCLVKVDNKLVIRKCAKNDDVAQCTDSKTCKTCENINCNIGIFPEGRLQCYQCNDSKCNDAAANNVSSIACVNFEEKDECYTKGESDANMVRGCKSDLKDNKCSSSAEGCAFCTDKNCNNLKYKRVQELKCHHCSSNSSTPNDDCFKSQTDTNYKNCEKEILYNEQEYCYTQIAADIIKRGCLHDNSNINADKCVVDGTTDGCSKCNQSNGCNNEPIEFTCIICRSDANPKCWNQAAELKGEKCRGEGLSTDGCFSGIWNNIAIRGCVVDASLQNQAVCKNPADAQCRICHTKNCNTEKSSASKLNISYGFMLIIFMALWKFK